MFVQPRPCVVDRLVPEVEVVRRDAFKLRDDLQRLDSVQKAGALDAVAFYGSRILEVLTGEALGVVGLKVLPQVAANLDTLYLFSLLPAPTLSWAHVLRHKGNDARHIRCQLSEDDAELVLALLTRWLRWYFCAFRYPDPLPHLTRDGGPLWDTDRRLEEFIDLLERREFPLDEVQRRIDEAGT